MNSTSIPFDSLREKTLLTEYHLIHLDTNLPFDPLKTFSTITSKNLTNRNNQVLP